MAKGTILAEGRLRRPEVARPGFSRDVEGQNGDESIILYSRWGGDFFRSCNALKSYKQLCYNFQKLYSEISVVLSERVPGDLGDQVARRLSGIEVYELVSYRVSELNNSQVNSRTHKLNNSKTLLGIWDFNRDFNRA